MTFVESELASQPACWRRAIEAAESEKHKLPWRGERVAVAGCGTSLFMAQAYARLREAAGHGETDAFAASELPPRPYDAVVVLSRSGTTTEVLELLGRLDGPRTIAVTAQRSSPVTTQAIRAVVLDFAAERSIVQTRFATSALVLLWASLGEDLTGQPGLTGAVADAERALSLVPPAPPGVHRHLTFLGRDWTNGLAQEAALKCRESAGIWAEAYPAAEYRHGPISAAHAESLIWSFVDPPPGLAGEIEARGATLVGPQLEPLAELVRVQRFAVDLARLAGRDPDRPPGLSYSVILGAG